MYGVVQAQGVPNGVRSGDSRWVYGVGSSRCTVRVCSVQVGVRRRTASVGLCLIPVLVVGRSPVGVRLAMSSSRKRITAHELANNPSATASVVRPG